MLSSSAFAQDIKGISFSHQDWEIYCSNTGTCRAAGYQNEAERNEPASLLLTRQAGPRQAVQVEFALARYEEESFPAAKLKNIHFYINGKDLGVVSFEGTEFPLMGKLSANQVNALLQQSRQQTEILFKNAQLQWNISDAGMTAVLLKMDDFQKRIGTVGALIKKGQADESKVLAAQPRFSVKQIKTSSKPYLTLQPNNKRYAALYRNLMAAQPMPKREGFCEGMYEDGETKPQTIELYKLTNKKVLAMTLCWRGAYNEGYGAWVLDDSLANKANFVTEQASEFYNGIISSSQKGRGIGDCWASDEWVWDGQKFVHTQDRWTGMCKGLAAGGVWDLDQIEAIVK
ncbi:PF06674 family protein [Acinetobacter sp. WC-323]|nr:PF06674 family protein [Acinetobacter sp. WC-323]